MQAEYSAFIASAYGISALAICGLLAWIFLDARAQRRALAALDAKGVRRRSAAGETAGGSGR
ncbi:heme exporter protein CcmD [Jiella sonneratiae]|uniref:Heme exporter protein D n=1 Tax=Jiella sonneratiae TaxID=2816856 RepID=A0ABS3J4P8_9HYPH|nr:heme exporter protein CcmD [Jiella sonneratiae]MBO0904655.1 heme exporter protein CcmD [Jiella sonneratiae]